MLMFLFFLLRLECVYWGEENVLSMDRDLLRQSVTFHGQSLFSLLKCEQSENPDFEHVTADLAKSVNQR